MSWWAANTVTDAATDAATVLALLRERGPRTVDQLCAELAGESSWDGDRVVQAVAAAWAQNLLSFDAEDWLVLL